MYNLMSLRNYIKKKLKYMFVLNTKFKNLLIIKKKINKDKRGFLFENFKKNKLNNNFVLDNIVYSKKNVLRGLHFQTKNQQAKYLTVIKGKILDVCLDLRKKSKTFGDIFSIILSEKNKTSLLIPKGFAHGYYTYADENIIYYKSSSYRQKKMEIGIKWNDVDLNINWPKKTPILSDRDKSNISFKDFLKKYKGL